MLKKYSIKEYTDDNELIRFCEETWGDYIRSLDNTVRTKLLSIQAHGLIKGVGYDDTIIDTYQSELCKFPPVPCDIVVYRGGEMKIPGRPFLSASFCKEKALSFANNRKSMLHPIIIRKGACVVPSLYLSMNGSFLEKEIVIDVSCLHKKIGYYEYCR